MSTAIIRLAPGGLEATLLFSLRDVTGLLGFDCDGDGHVSPLELARGESALRQKAAESLEVWTRDRLVTVGESRCRFDPNGNVRLQLAWSVRLDSALVFRSKWLALLPAGHRQFFAIHSMNGGVLAERLLSAASDSLMMEPGTPDKGPSRPSNANSFTQFLMLGVKHILTGYDHLLFLFSLLIVSQGFFSTLKIVSCFTAAHSTTLVLATLGAVRIPGRLVEPMIAASIIYVGVENFARGRAPKNRALLTFAFGLVHGFGFASVLRELGVGAGGSGIVAPLFSFNLGVELGQLVIAAAVLPLIWRVRKRPVFARLGVPACSILVTLAGSFWLVERIWFAGLV